MASVQAEAVEVLQRLLGRSDLLVFELKLLAHFAGFDSALEVQNCPAAFSLSSLSPLASSLQTLTSFRGVAFLPTQPGVEYMFRSPLPKGPFRRLLHNLQSEARQVTLTYPWEGFPCLTKSQCTGLI